MSRLALCDVVGPLNDLNQKLAGENGDRWLEDFKRFLRGEVTTKTSSPLLTWQLAEEKAYQMMGLLSQYLAFRQEVNIQETPGRWNGHMVQGVTCAKIVAALKEAGSGLWSYYDNLDKAVTKNDRHPSNGSYVFDVAANIEADEENKNKSANMLAKENHQGITVMERLFIELVYFLLTGEHLDIKNWTLCSGSRDANDDVPNVHFSLGNREVKVSYYRVGSRDDIIRSRSVRVLAKPAGVA